MSIEDFSIQTFQAQISTIVTQYFTSHPEDLHNVPLRRRIIESITQSLEDQQAQKYSLNESNSHTFYFGSICRADDFGDEALPHLNMDRPINQDKEIVIMDQVKYEQAVQPSKKSQDYQENFYFGLEKQQKQEKIDQIIYANQFILEKNIMQTKQGAKGEMLGEVTVKCESFIQEQTIKNTIKGIKNQNDEYQDNKSETFEYNQDTYYSKKKKNMRSSKLFENKGQQIKHQTKNRNKPQLRRPCFPQMQQLLINWIKMNCLRGIIVSQYEIRKEAMRIIQTLDRSKHPYFRASKGWLEKFFKRNIEVYHILSRQRHKSHINSDFIF